MPPIICTSQQSRFHTETLDTASKEIDMKGVSISIGNVDLLVDSHLRLKAGTRYGFLGRNGTGKSTLFLALRDNLIPGFPPSVRVLLVSQTESDSASVSGGNVDDVALDEISVMDKVISSDRVRAKAMGDFEELNEALESQSVITVQAAVAMIEFERAQEDLEEKRKLASRRSGARGKEARKEELKAEAKLAEAEKKLAGMTLDEGEDPFAVAHRLIEELQTTLDSVDYKTTTSRAWSVLLGLGFTKEMIEGPYSNLSGGWKSRCALASALLMGSDVLLLDEPSNFLDLPATLWLENYLIETAQDRTVVLTSHDQDFLDSVTQETMYLRKQTLRYFEGTPAQLDMHERKERKHKMRLQHSLDKRKAHIEASIQQGKATAKKTGDDNRMRMAVSRQKKLDERWGLEKSAKGTRFKLNRDFGGYALTNRAEIEIEEQEPPVHIVIPPVAKLRTLGDLVTFDKVTFKYRRAAAPLLQDVSFSVPQGGRVAFVGAGQNGQGKSTIANLILQQLKPTTGKVQHHPLLRIGHYSQHSVEEITKAVQGTKTTALQYFVTYFGDRGDKVEDNEAMECLGRLGLRGRIASATPVEGLSGGQKVRLAFSLIIFRPPPLLLLDEVTTHLDLATINALAVALRSFEGAIVLITHDRWFCRVVIEGVPLREPAEDDSDEGEEDDGAGAMPRGQVYRVNKGQVVEMSGGMDEYVQRVEKELVRKAATNAALMPG